METKRKIALNPDNSQDPLIHYSIQGGKRTALPQYGTLCAHKKGSSTVFPTNSTFYSPMADPE